MKKIYSKYLKTVILISFSIVGFYNTMPVYAGNAGSAGEKADPQALSKIHLERLIILLLQNEEMDLTEAEYLAIYEKLFQFGIPQKFYESISSDRNTQQKEKENEDSGEFNPSNEVISSLGENTTDGSNEYTIKQTAKVILEADYRSKHPDEEPLSDAELEKPTKIFLEYIEPKIIKFIDLSKQSKKNAEEEIEKTRKKSGKFLDDKILDTCPKIDLGSHKKGVTNNVVNSLARTGDVLIDREGKMSSNSFDTKYYLVDVSSCVIKTPQGCDERVNKRTMVKGRETVYDTRVSVDLPLIGTKSMSPARSVLTNEPPSATHSGAIYDGQTSKEGGPERRCYYHYLPHGSPDLDSLKVQFSITKVPPSVTTQSAKQIAKYVFGEPANTFHWFYRKDNTGYYHDEISSPSSQYPEDRLPSKGERPRMRGDVLSQDIDPKAARNDAFQDRLGRKICPHRTAAKGYNYIYPGMFNELMEKGEVKLDNNGDVDPKGTTFYLYKVYHCDQQDLTGKKCLSNRYKIEYGIGGQNYIKENPINSKIDSNIYKDGNLILKGGGYEYDLSAFERLNIKTDFGEPIKDLCVYTYTPEKYFLSSSNFPEEGYDTKNDVLVVLTTIPPDKS